jgi:hypothetical protein
MLGDHVRRLAAARPRAERLTVDQAAGTLGVTPAAYRALEAGERWPGWEMYDPTLAFGWPRSFR